jgi:hypothetical protein
MSYEYLAPLPEAAIPSSTELLELLKLQLPIAAVCISKNKLSLRWADLAMRAEWPEDIDLFRNTDGLLVSFHVGTAEQRNILLNILRDELAKVTGISFDFEEQ